jgi:dTDP-glucose 4,6-dehydratase
VTIVETAEAVCRALDKRSPIVIAQKPNPSRPPQRYVPDTTRAEKELDLRQRISLDEAIRKTAQWNLQNRL